MRIIKHGTIYEIAEVTCPDCQCIFRYNQRDIERETYYEDDGMYGRDEYTRNIVKCPECKKHIIVKE